MKLRGKRAARAMIGKTIARAECTARRVSEGLVVHDLWIVFTDGSRLWLDPEAEQCVHCFDRGRRGALPVLVVPETN